VVPGRLAGGHPYLAIYLTDAVAMHPRLTVLPWENGILIIDAARDRMTHCEFQRGAYGMNATCRGVARN
jgi:hypothetical protein